MEWFFKLVPTLGGRLLALAAVMAVLMSTLVLLLLAEMRSETEAFRSVYEDRVVPLGQLKAVSDAYAVNIVDTVHKVRSGAVSWEQGAKRVDDAKSIVATEWKAYLGTYLVATEKQLATELQTVMDAADKDLVALRAVLLAKDEAALSDFALKRLYQSIDPISDKINALVNLQMDVAKRSYSGAVADYQQARTQGIVGLLVSLAIGLGLAWVIARRVLRSLGAEPRQLREAVTAIGKGDLSQRIGTVPGDEASVAVYAAQMQESLRKLVANVRDAAQRLRGSAQEISAGNMDLSNRTEETAAAMAAAASRLQEVMQRVQARAGNLAQARERVGSTRQVASNAGEQMAAVIATMSGINESARRIGDIIGTIDGIAFQTNILALNAAVEAARAGEQGRGFAVVAGEVRSLAQRSAAAAREIKTLISASMERADAGAREVDATGATLQSMVIDIQKLADLVAQIAAEAAQDDTDMGSVLHRLQQVDQSVQQNAALVEQMAASSQSLNDQSANMTEAVGGFRT